VSATLRAGSGHHQEIPRRPRWYESGGAAAGAGGDASQVRERAQVHVVHVRRVRELARRGGGLYTLHLVAETFCCIKPTHTVESSESSCDP
jgi:hypothetical protein